MTLDWQTISIIVGFLALYTKVVYDYSKIKTELQNNGAILIKLETMLSNHDKVIDELATRLTTLETKHNEHHKRKDDN
jgi:hypothetical protein